MRIKKILFFLIFISCKNIGEDYKWKGDDVPGFSRKFGTIGYDYGWSAAFSPIDNGIIITGKRTLNINGDSDLWAIKTDSKGILEWEKSFGGSLDEEGYDVIATSDGGFLFVGYTWSKKNAQQIYAIKTDFNGIIIWEKTYGGSMWDVGTSIIEIPNNGYVIAGFSNSPGISSGNTDILLIKIDNNGDKIWQKSYGNLAFPNHEWAYDINLTPDKGFIIVGARDRYNEGGMNGLVIRIDESGNLIWEKELFNDGQSSETIYSISSSLNGSYYLCMTSNSINNSEIFEPTIIKIDSSGNIDWKRKFVSSSQNYHQFRATTTLSGDIIIIGSASHELPLGYKDDAFMIKIDSNGNILWTNSYGSADEDDWGWSVFETPNENIVFVGSTKSFGASLFDIYLVGTNSEGKSK